MQKSLCGNIIQAVQLLKKNMMSSIINSLITMPYLILGATDIEVIIVFCKVTWLVNFAEALLQMLY